MAKIASVVGLLSVAALAGCVTRPAAPTSAPSALPSAAIAPSQRTLAYPHGQYVLHGDGTARSPYVWMWVPNVAASPSSR